MSHFSTSQTGRIACTYWILIHAVCYVLCAVVFSAYEPVHAQDSATTVDQAYLQIQPQTLKDELLKASHDSVKLYDLVRRADHQNLANVAYNTLNEMRHQQPRNAVVVAAYCFSFQVAAGDYDNPGRKNRPFTEAEHKSYEDALNKAYQLDPKLWLPYTVEGHYLMASPYEDVKALRLLQKAVALAPSLSYTHILLAEAYTVHGTPYHSYSKAVQECETARRLQPASAKNADILFDIYDIRTPNRKKAADAKRYLLSTLPPGFKFSQSFEERLARY